MIGLAMGGLGFGGDISHDDKKYLGAFRVVGNLEVETALFDNLRARGMGLQEIRNRAFFVRKRLEFDNSHPHGFFSRFPVRATDHNRILPMAKCACLIPIGNTVVGARPARMLAVKPRNHNGHHPVSPNRDVEGERDC